MALEKWLYRECCNAVMKVDKIYGKIEMFRCECGRTVDGQFLKYLDSKEDAIAARRKHKGFGMPGLDDLGEGDLDSYLEDHQGGL